MNIIDNIYDALFNTTGFTFLVLGNLALLFIVLYTAFKKPSRGMKTLAGILFVANLFITVPIAFDMFFK